MKTRFTNKMSSICLEAETELEREALDYFQRESLKKENHFMIQNTSSNTSTNGCDSMLIGFVKKKK